MTVSTNYLSPNVEVKLISPRGRTLNITEPPSSQQRSRLGVYLQQVSAKLTLGMTNEITASFKAPRDVVDRVLTEELEYFLPGGFITVRMGYSGGPYTQEFSGVITAPNLSLEPDGITLSVTGKGGLWYSSRADTARTFNNESVLDCLKLICADHSTEVFYLSPDQGEIPFTRAIGERLAISQKIDILNPVFETFQGRDWFTMKTLVQERARMRFYVSGQRLVLFSMSEQAIVTKAPRFVWQLPSDPSNGVYPMISFQTENSEYPITVGLRELIARDINPDDKTLFELIRSRSSADVDAPQTKRAGVPETGRQFAGDGPPPTDAIDRNLLAVSAREPDPEGKMIRAKNIGEEQGGISATWQVLGNPNITPGRLCPVEGVTRLYSGNYFTREVNYTFGLDGFKCDVSGFTMGYATNPYEFLQTSQAQADREIAPDASGVSRGAIGRTPT